MSMSVRLLRPLAGCRVFQRACYSDLRGPGAALNSDLEILDRALTHVDQLGWTRDALTTAARDLGYSPMAHTVCERGPVGLVGHFMDRALDETQIEADDQLHEFGDNTTDKLRFLCRTRLRQTQPYLRRWPEAAALLAQPQNVPLAIQKLTDLTVKFYSLAGDQSVHVDWYLKRSSLAAAYLAAELYMCEDKSPNFRATWDLVDRQIRHMDSAEKLGASAALFGSQFSRNFYNILASRGYVAH
ncbi:Ubiquinone biosynthesis protein coq9, mitochondrial [Coemansia sp. RSA 552]|nr:Ubiquinone biosynthesis protein coq9, mitochondrial [Coemansia sp. RSA 552]